MEAQQASLATPRRRPRDANPVRGAAFDRAFPVFGSHYHNLQQPTTRDQNFSPDGKNRSKDNFPADEAEKGSNFALGFHHASTNEAKDSVPT